MEKVILGGYVKIKTGKLDANASDEDGIYPFFTCAKEISRINTYAFDCECVLVAGNGELNAKFYSGKFNAYQRTYVIEVLDKSILSTKFLFYFINKHIEKLRNGAIGGVIKYIKLNHLTDIEIPLPDIDTQNKIVAILDKAKTTIEKREKTITFLDELLQATFLDMFGDPVINDKGWEKVELEKLGIFKNGLNYTQNEAGFKVRCLGVGDFKNKSRITDFNSLTTINLSSNPSEDFFLKDGDLVFVRSNGNKELVGRCVEIFPKNEKISFSGFCIRYRIQSDGILSTFLNQVFRLPTFKKTMLDGGRGANIQNVNQEILGNLKIPIPPLELQNKFIKSLNQIHQTKEKLNQSKTQLENLFNGLLQLAFNGTLKFNTAVDLEILLENDYEFFKANSNKKTIELLLQRLNKSELNEHRFYSQDEYNKAKELVFGLLKDGTVKQVFDKKTNQIKLTV